MNPAAAKRLRLLASALSVLLVAAVAAAGWAYLRVRASLPQLDGNVALAGLGAPVSVQRDALGVPTIRGETRTDVARALGWLHGQDRFFQMDLLRRVPAGELSEMFGKRALPRDRSFRMHGFRKLAQSIIAGLDPKERAILEAYTAGVNAGLNSLGERPWEYLVLREQPRPWLPEDTMLVIHAMSIDLQDEDGIYERTLMTIRDEMGLDAVAFFAPMITPGDAALDGTTGAIAPIPGPKAINLRRDQGTNGSREAHPKRTVSVDMRAFDQSPKGSNVFALGGAHTASGAGLLANDMHLDHGVPNIWYRASLEIAGKKVTGVTLPGTPVVVAGSNGQIAWGFTDSYADAVDVVEVQVNSIAPSLYTAPGRDEPLRIEQRHEIIRVKGEDPEEIDYPWTIWGPILPGDERKRPLALRWLAHDREVTNLHLIAMEDATTVAEGVAVAHRAGMPAQNIVIVDRTGEVAWTIAGQLPKRVGFDGRLPVTWAFGDRRWDGCLPPDEVPVVWGKDSTLPGRIWSANGRQVGGAALAKLGDGAYRRSARAAQIRDDLAPLERATPRDLLAVQLDDRAFFLERWHKLMMETLTPAVVAQKKSRALLRSYAEKWEGRASIEAVSYRLVREFRTAVFARVFPPIFQSCVDAFPRFDWRELQLEGAMWALLREKPVHLLSAEFANWDELLVAAADDVVKATDREGLTFPQANWGMRNRARIRHPFAMTFPWLAQWISMPPDPLPGDVDMPRVQGPGQGASERLVVSPGREEEGIFHMPCGQSSHPLSPYFSAGHTAWVRGEPTPFLPGKTEHTLTLKP